MTITYDEVRKYFDYDPATGNLINKVTRNYNALAGSAAGSVDNNVGYLRVSFNYKRYWAHRLVWLWHHGYMPENNIDHINQIKTDNRIENLREVSRQCNVRNCGNHCNNTSGVKGVSFERRRSRWQVHIWVWGKQYYLGLYTDFDNAVCARLAAEQCLNWDGCDSSSPAYKHVKERIQKNDLEKI